ncbi:MAG: LiaI-LiaF-like domain-containing protein [Sphingobacteriales bacterium]
METQNISPNKPNNGKVMAGIIIVIIGGLLLINQFDMFFIPRWLFSWPMWIIAYGLYMGGKYNFRKQVWVWMIIIGTAFLFTENIHNSERLVWPLAIIGAGTWTIMRHNNKIRDVQYPDSSYKEI